MADLISIEVLGATAAEAVGARAEALRVLE